MAVVVFQIVEGPSVGTSFRFDDHRVFLLGRHPDCALGLGPDTFVSRVHAIAEVSPPRCRIRDLDSKNGTFVNGQRIEEAELSDGDKIKIGRTVLQVRITQSDPNAGAFLQGEFLGAQVASQEAAVSDTGQEIECFRCGKFTDSSAQAGDDVPLCNTCRESIDSSEIVPGYRCVRRIGGGGMGEVWLAKHFRTDERFAIKIVRPDVSMNPTIIRMFERERDISLSLVHPRIVRCFSGGQYNSVLFLVTEFVDGVDAEKLRKDHLVLPPRDAVQIVIQTLEALSYAHQRQVVHRDIKPSNILVQGSPGSYQAKVTDFGIARIYGATGNSGITQKGDVRGTLPYMAPEQLTDSRSVDHRADIFGVGATLYYLLTSAFVYDFHDESHCQRVVAEGNTVPIERRGVSLDSELCRIVNRAIQKRPDDRFNSADEMREALEAIAR